VKVNRSTSQYTAIFDYPSLQAFNSRLDILQKYIFCPRQVPKHCRKHGLMIYKPKLCKEPDFMILILAFKIYEYLVSH